MRRDGWTRARAMLLALGLAADKYALTDGEGLYDRFYEMYQKFSERLTKYQL